MKNNKEKNKKSTQAGSFKISSAFGLKDFFGLITAYGLFVFLVSSPVNAVSPNTLPTGYQSVAGNVQFQQNNNTLNVTSQSSKAIANYQSFSIGQNASVNFLLPSTNSVILNRVVGSNLSEIFGSMNSNGKVFLINPNGILFASSARVNMGSILASTLSINDSDFLNGNIVLKQNGSSAAVVNQGLINVSQGGSIVLLGGAVQNSGSINAPLGNVLLAVGDKATVSLGDNLNINVTVDKPLQDKVEAFKNAVSNTGFISANGGSVRLEAQLQNAFYEKAVNNEGVIQANSLINHNGSIEILAQSNDGMAIAENSGQLIALGEETKGGNIKILGDAVLVDKTSLVDVSGQTGGGEVLIGGDFQGKNHDVHNAKRTFIDKNAQIKADALKSGDGGKVIVWADEATWLYGNISAKGGALSGSGGFAEVSGKEGLDAPGIVDLTAQNGATGTLLYDPSNIVINAGTGDGSDSTALNNTLKHNINPLGSIFLINTPTNFTIFESEIENSNANIVLQATNNITNNAQLNLTTGNNFTATAGNNITFATGSGLTTINGNITLGAGNSIALNNADLLATNGNVSLGTVGSSISGTGTITANDLTVFTAGGSMTQSGLAGGANFNTNVTNLTVTSGGGTIRISDVNDINLKASTVGLGSLSVRAGGSGSITQSGAVTGNSLNFRAGSGNILMSSFANNANGLSLRTDGGNASFKDTNGFNVNSIQLNDGTGANGDLTLTAGGAGNVSQFGTITEVNKFNLIAGTGTATLNNVNNNVNAFTSNTAAGNVSIIAFIDTNGFTVGNSNVSNGTLALTAAGGGTGSGNIVQETGTSVQGNNLQLKVGSGEAAFFTLNNDFQNIQMTVSSGTIAYLDVNDINLQASNVGSSETLVIGSEGGNVTQNSALTGGNLVAGTGLGGSVNLSNANNNFSSLSGFLLSGGSISYTDADSIKLSSYTSAPGSNLEAQLMAFGLPNIVAFDLGGGNLNVVAGAGITTVNNVSNGNSISLQSNAGDIDGAGLLNASNLLLSSSNDINANTQTTNLTAKAAANVILNEIDDVNLVDSGLNSNQAGAAYSLVAGGPVTVIDSVNAGVNISLTGSGVKVNNNLTAPIISLEASTGDINVNGGTINATTGGASSDGTLNLTAQNGNIFQSGGEIQTSDLNIALNGADATVDLNNVDSYKTTVGGTGTIADYTQIEKDGFIFNSAKQFDNLTLGADASLTASNDNPMAGIDLTYGDETQIVADKLSGNNLNVNGSGIFTNMDFATVSFDRGTEAGITVTYSETDGVTLLDSDLGTGSLQANINTNGNPLDTLENPYGESPNEQDLHIAGNISGNNLELNSFNSSFVSNITSAPTGLLNATNLLLYSEAGAIGTNTNFVNTQTTNLAAVANEDVFINEQDGVILQNLTSAFGSGTLGNGSNSGNFTVNTATLASGDLSIQNTVSAIGDVTLTTTQDNSTIDLGANSALTVANTTNILTIGNNSDITQALTGVLESDSLNIATTSSNATLIGENQVSNLLANTNSGVIALNNLIDLNLLNGTNVSEGSLLINNAADVNFPLDGSILGHTIKVSTSNNGNINLLNSFVGGHSEQGSSVAIISDGNVNGLTADRFPRLFANTIIIEGDKVADRNAPIGLWQGITDGYILDRSNQTTLSPASFAYIFGGSDALNTIRTLLISSDGYFMYPELVFNFDNSIYKPNKAKDGTTPVIAKAIQRGTTTSAFGNLFITTAGTFVLYGDKDTLTASANNQIKQANEYVQASGKLVLPDSNVLASNNDLTQSSNFIKTAGQVVNPLNNEPDSSVEYTIFTGTVLPMNNAEINSGRDLDREISKVELSQ